MKNTPSAIDPGKPIEKRSAFEFYPTGVKAIRPFTFSELNYEFKRMKIVREATLWIIGDLLNLGEGTFGEKFAQMIDPAEGEYAMETYRNAAYVCQRIPFEMRDPTIPRRIYQNVAKLPQDKMLDILDRVKREKLTSDDVRILVIAKRKKRIPLFAERSKVIEVCVEAIEEAIEELRLLNANVAVLGKLKAALDFVDKYG